ncbi:hypothetical protein C9374_012739 [Naegleria lovaniensis]|uniref:Uncharacterized protein n=1 Tax=Naegleria lovaniensis TaxID=51637 RepID=A0AA88H3P1_NAELO|nr:uncharacterized protein C9374_012739 [Naegleria lovaniensis]KAG2392487.1 hypothetical protein C9374_012739 [Naegleria lovaniensis]
MKRNHMITNSEHSNVQQQHQQIPISPSGCLFVALIGAVDTGKTSLLNCISESKNNYYNNYSSSIPYWSLLSNAVTSSNSHEYLRSVIFSHHDDIDPQQKEWHYIRFLDKQHRKVRNDSIYAQLMNTTMDGMILVVDCVEGYHSNLDYVLGEQLFSKTNGRKMKPL